MIDSVESPYIHAASAESFKALVLENSHKGPVLVNFWSRKAGPCLRQYPLLDKVIHQYAGRVLLINVDADAEVKITSEYGVNSVPTLKLFRREEVVETRHGYQSEDELVKLLDKYVARDSDRVLAEAVKLYTEGKAVQAYEAITQAIVEDPANPRLPLAMCKLLKHEERYTEAVKVIEALPSEVRKDREIEQFYALLHFYDLLDASRNRTVLQQQLTEQPDNHDLRRQLIAHYVVEGDYTGALQELVDLMQREPGFADNYAQQAMLRVFIILGDGHPLISQYRTQLRRYAH